MRSNLPLTAANRFWRRLAPRLLDERRLFGQSEPLRTFGHRRLQPLIAMPKAVFVSLQELDVFAEVFAHVALKPMLIRKA